MKWEEGFGGGGVFLLPQSIGAVPVHRSTPHTHLVDARIVVQTTGRAQLPQLAGVSGVRVSEREGGAGGVKETAKRRRRPPSHDKG